MNIFQTLNRLLHSKRRIDLNRDDETEVSPYMINRWISMYSSDLAIIINNTTNWLHSVFETKQQYCDFLMCVLPRVSNKRIHYIKKHKPQDKKEQIENLDLIAKRLELSKREIKSYYEFQNNCTTSTSRS